MALRLAARGRIAGSEAVRGIPEAQGLGGLGDFGGAAEVALRVVPLSQLLGKARQVQVGRARLLERQARFEEAARLAPQLGLHAQPAEGSEELRVAAALEEPLLGALD